MVHHAARTKPVQPPPAMTAQLLTHTPPNPAAFVMTAMTPAGEAVSQIHSLAERAQVDEAIDYAARVLRATVGEFVAAPSVVGAPGLPCVDLAVEFFIPPASADAFADEVDRALIRRSPAYFAARRSDQIRPIRLTLLPPGSFHQWRMVWKKDPAIAQENRWSAHRRIFESVLHQASTGWRELMVPE